MHCRSCIYCGYHMHFRQGRNCGQSVQGSKIIAQHKEAVRIQEAVCERYSEEISLCLLYNKFL